MITVFLIRYHFLVISKTMHISKFFIEEKVLKNLFSISVRNLFKEFWDTLYM